MTVREEGSLEEMTVDELTSRLGRLSIQVTQMEKQMDRIMAELGEREATNEDYTHCVLCGDKLTNEMDWDTGVCTPCAEVGG